MMVDKEQEKQMAAKEAVKLVKPNQVVGLGTGSTAMYVVHEIGKLVQAGLQIRAIPTSDRTAALATSLDITLVDINTVEAIDITIDGADEFTPDLSLLKGGGGALLKEKIVASLTREEIIITDSSKQVAQLGKFPLPVEVIPFASNYVLRQLALQGGTGQIRMVDSQPFITDEGNYIIDTNFGLIADPAALSNTINQVNGVVAHGLFIKLASKVIMGVGDSTVTFSGK
jgi:ribose 5-phosphate isomerase A